MTGNFSVPPFRALIAAGYRPVGLILPPVPGMRTPIRPLRYPTARKTPLDPSRASEGNLLELAAEHRIPTYEIGDFNSPQALALLQEFAPDLVVVACFPRLLPEPWWKLPKYGALNIHPSLLPAYRGPYPLLWQFWHGERNTGVTLHFIAEGADTGDLVAQSKVSLPDGISEAEADTLLSERGARLLLEILKEPDRIPRTPQPHRGASFHARPGPDDLCIPLTWTARRAFNFVRGSGSWGPFTLKGSRFSQKITAVETYQTGKKLTTPFESEGNFAWIRFADGAVKALIE